MNLLLSWYCVVVLLLLAYEANGLKRRAAIRSKFVAVEQLQKRLEKKPSHTLNNHPLHINPDSTFYGVGSSGNYDSNNNNNNNNKNNKHNNDQTNSHDQSIEDQQIDSIENLVDADLRQPAGTNDDSNSQLAASDYSYGDVLSDPGIWEEAEAEIEANFGADELGAAANSDYLYETEAVGAAGTNEEAARSDGSKEFAEPSDFGVEWPPSDESGENFAQMALARADEPHRSPAPLPGIPGLSPIASNEPLGDDPKAGEFAQSQKWRREPYPWSDLRFPGREFAWEPHEMADVDYPERGQQQHLGRQHKSVDVSGAVDENEHNPGMFVRVTHKAFNFIAVVRGKFWEFFQIHLEKRKKFREFFQISGKFFGNFHKNL
ncbi:unnamed protein product [Anisakis simplex]|uniref:Midasin n=1 Tax=Anisakis simplex TaxID=6269 RepID=A0A0M3J4K3_ANISI|nr:unnamed protein product [Anisakis simplex]